MYQQVQVLPTNMSVKDRIASMNRTQALVFALKAVPPPALKFVPAPALKVAAPPAPQVAAPPAPQVATPPAPPASQVSEQIPESDTKPSLVAKKESYECKFGEKCSKIGKCPFAHPHLMKRHQSHAPPAKQIPCRDGDRCSRPNCHYGHPEKDMKTSVPAPPPPPPSVIPAKQIPCRNGSGCSRLNCHFGHPEKDMKTSVPAPPPPPRPSIPIPVHTHVRPCRYGSKCRNNGCLYSHSQTIPIAPSLPN